MTEQTSSEVPSRPRGWTEARVVVRKASALPLLLAGAVACASAGRPPRSEGTTAPREGVATAESVVESGGTPPEIPSAAAAGVAARDAEVAGRARISMRIEADGSTSDHTVVFATEPSFGAACIRLVAEARFAPARDRWGRAVPVRTSFTCEFEPADGSALAE
ncbi:MAG: energy transducer TonB [Myxococcota bacterium]